jgi:hypothetical protein
MRFCMHAAHAKVPAVLRNDVDCCGVYVRSAMFGGAARAVP